jgi:hypothetical protein
MNTQNTQNTPQDDERAEDPADRAEARPLGYWLRTVDRLLSDRFARAFESEGLTRRDWRLMNLIDGTVPGRRLGEGRGPSPDPDGGHDRDFRRDFSHDSDHSRGHRRAKRLRRLAERGWIEEFEGDWRLTDSGREAKKRLAVEVDGIRAMVAEAVGPDDYTATVRSLEQIAVALGWDPDAPVPPRRGTGRKHHPRWGSERGGSWGEAPGFGRDRNRDRRERWDHPGHPGHPGLPGHPGDCDRRGPARFAQQADARGFEAGFTSGRRF